LSGCCPNFLLFTEPPITCTSIQQLISQLPFHLQVQFRNHSPLQF
jgi:hypothetical protein